MAKDIRDIKIKLDTALLQALPVGGEVVSVVPLGLSNNCETCRIDVRLSGGGMQSFFEKSGKGEDGRELMLAHWTAESSLYSFIPGHVPRPIAVGAYESVSSPVHFFLMEFADLVPAPVPNPAAFMAPVIALHRASMAKSPGGQFGFPVRTRFGHLAQDNTWESSWEVWWTKHMTMTVDREREIRGPYSSPEVAPLRDAFLNMVLPRYLRPLETGGRSVAPCLLHTDLWPGNVQYCRPGNANDEMKVAIFDANGLWGHNEGLEAELGIISNPRCGVGQAYVDEYRKHMPASEPAVDADSRAFMYMIRHQICFATLYPGDPSLRDM
ncbi:Fructosamine/Ketosamine-3-kinase [Lasiosphaeria miniovina]|uniref:protein-ribulosamine 3-kinase n=1 Tax=Lasiosphaeria miniovina TaxID=1954250 RepID=A0AA40AKD4_9PEZI|nr:Fructosamine/Ketosamine-3-kinase [Lasiosphaeria miniovina]KAK0717419.1 Fructosamine/Ketosamine-3-kinase [Lasiosphaeria miniovina]